MRSIAASVEKEFPVTKLRVFFSKGKLSLQLIGLFLQCKWSWYAGGEILPKYQYGVHSFLHTGTMLLDILRTPK